MSQFLVAFFALIAIAVILQRRSVRERRLAKIYERVLDFCEDSSDEATDLMYHEFQLPDGTRARPIDLVETDAQFDLLDTALGRIEHGVYS